MKKIDRNQEIMSSNNSILDAGEASLYPENTNIYKIKFSTLSELPFGCKLVFIISFVLSIFEVFFKNYQQKIFFWAIRILVDEQYYRLFFSYLLDGWDQMGIVNLVAKFIWLRLLFCLEERKLSTIHFLIDIFLQSLVLNILLVAWSYILYATFELSFFNYLVKSDGIIPLVMIFIWSEVARYANYRIDFSFLPFLVTVKYIPIFVLIYRASLGLDYFWADLFGFFFGYIQFMIFKKRMTRIPFIVFQKIEWIVPNFIKNNPSFIKISDVQIDLKFECWNGGNLQNLSRVGAVGGVQIDNTNEESREKPENFQEKWKNYSEDLSSNETKRDEFELEAKFNESEQQFSNQKLNSLGKNNYIDSQQPLNSKPEYDPYRPYEVSPQNNGMIGGSQIGFYERWKSYSEQMNVQPQQSQKTQQTTPNIQNNFYLQETEQWYTSQETTNYVSENLNPSENPYVSENLYASDNITGNSQIEPSSGFSEVYNENNNNQVQVEQPKPQKSHKSIESDKPQKAKKSKGVQIGKGRQKVENFKQRWIKFGDKIESKSKQEIEAQRDDYLLQMNLKAFEQSDPQDETQSKRLIN